MQLPGGWLLDRQLFTTGLRLRIDWLVVITMFQGTIHLRQPINCTGYLRLLMGAIEVPMGSPANSRLLQWFPTMELCSLLVYQVAQYISSLGIITPCQ